MSRLSRREMAKRAVEANWQRTRTMVSLAVTGTSMGDTIPRGSTIEVAFHEKPRPRRGDIIYFRRGELRVAHRLLMAVGPICVEKGDANRYPGLCLRQSVLGLVGDVRRRPLAPISE